MSPANKSYIGCGLASLAIVLFFVLALPAWDRISALATAISEREDLISSRQQIIQRINTLSQQYEERQEDINRITSILPSNKSIPEIVTAIEALAQQSGLSLTSLTASTIGNDDTLQPKRVFVEFGISGAYTAVTTFINSLETNLRIMDIESLNLSGSTREDVANLLEGRIGLEAYYITTTE